MSQQIIKQVEQPYLKKDVPTFDVGDTVDVAIRIVEGDKERIQVFSGTVIMKKGSGVNETFTVRRIVNNEGVERALKVHSPFVAGVTVRRSGKARRAKLYYLRDRVGKAVRLTEKKRKPAKAQEPEAPETPADEEAESRELAATAT